MQAIVDAWVIKLDAKGNVQWQKTYGGKGVDEAYSIQQTKDGGYIVAGIDYSPLVQAGRDAWIIKLDARGQCSMAKDLWREKTMMCAYSIQQTSDGGYIVAGETDSFDAG